jgi:mannose-6-phosphate isomerase-like protein (cupin superfamily)
VAELATDRDRWQHLVRHAGDARVYEQMWNDERVNAWVICWSEDQDTGFHDHDQSGAAIAVISGQVREERLRVGAPTARQVVGPGSTITIPPVAIHRVRHAGATPAVTIHAYSPPLVRTGVYRLGAAGELERRSMSVEEDLRAEAELVLAASRDSRAGVGV